MPYLASPPEPPPTIIAPSPKETHPPYASSSTPSDLASPQVANRGIQGSPPLETAAQSPPTVMPVAEFVKQSGESKASLLGATSAAGFLNGTDKPMAPSVSIPSPLPASGTVKPSQFQGNAPVPNLGPGQPPTKVVPTSSPLFYSLSGVTAGGKTARESDVMVGLNQVMTLTDLQEGLMASITEFRKKSAAKDISSRSGQLQSGQSQSEQRTGQLPASPPVDPSEPRQGEEYLPRPIVPVPGGPRSPDVDEGGPVFSVPGRLPPLNDPLQPGVETRPPDPNTAARAVELTADRQEYDEQRQVFTAEGNVTMRYQGGLLDADRLQVNLGNRVAVAEGNVALTRGNQVLRGQRIEYNFVQGIGTIFNARGEISIPASQSDFAALPNDPSANVLIGRPASDRITANQPTQNVSSPGAVSFGIGLGRDVRRIPGALPTGGQIRRLRFEAQQIDFTPDGWVARTIKITNDPFSPPQLILEADEATLTRLSPLQDEIRARRPRLVFDQRVRIPLPITRRIIDRGERQPPLVQFGYDDDDRGGLFIQRPFNIINTPQFQFTLSPQIYIQRAIFDSDKLLDLDNFGAVARLRYNISPQTSVRAFASLTSLDLEDYQANLRASLRARQTIGTHTLALEYSYRDRLFNGSLGFQTVQSSLGALLTSPLMELGRTGISMRYQAGFQYINSSTDRLDLLGPAPENDRVSLGRFQAAVTLSRGFYLWQGQPLPATPELGLRNTPNPVVPYISMGIGLTGVTSGYTNGENQSDLIGSVSLFGQFGHFSRPFFDYTSFSVSYFQVAGTGESPFFFDRTVDNRVLVLAFTQQIYGPVRLTVQTSINLDSREQISTDYILELSRRAYGILLRYNPVLEIGSIGIRISDFNWTGSTEPFSGTAVTPIQFGVRPTIED